MCCLKVLQKRRQFVKGRLTHLSNLLSVNNLRTTLKPSLLVRAPSSICSQVICMNVSHSGDPLGKGACLMLAFFHLRISDTFSPAEVWTIVLSFFLQAHTHSSTHYAAAAILRADR